MNDAGCHQMRTIDDEMCGFPIERIAQRMQFFELAKGILHAQQRSITIMPGTLEQHERWNIEIDHPAGIVQAFPVFRAQDDAATGGEYDVRPRSQFGDRQRFPAPESFLALDLEDGRDRHTGTGDDFMVGIIEAATETSCELSSYGRLSGPHQANEVDIAALIHAGILSGLAPHYKRERPARPAFLSDAERIDQLICSLSEMMRGVMKNSNSRLCPASF